jgi:hypothetical protein
MFRNRQAAAQQARAGNWQESLETAGISLRAPENRSAIGVGDSPPAWLSPHNAIGLGLDWIDANAPVRLTAGEHDCNAIWINGHWVVTCSVTLAGCSGAHCVASLSLCVFAEEPIVVPDLRC